MSGTELDTRSPILRKQTWILPFPNLKSARKWESIKDTKLKVTKIYMSNYDNCYEGEKEDAMIAYDRGEGDPFRLGGAGKSSLRNWHLSCFAIQIYPNTIGLKGCPNAWPSSSQQKKEASYLQKYGVTCQSESNSYIKPYIRQCKYRQVLCFSYWFPLIFLWNLYTYHFIHSSIHLYIYPSIHPSQSIHSSTICSPQSQGTTLRKANMCISSCKWRYIKEMKGTMKIWRR